MTSTIFLGKYFFLLNLQILLKNLWLFLSNDDLAKVLILPISLGGEGFENEQNEYLI